MRPELTCRIVLEEDLAERYVTGALEGDELEEFEAHIIECSRCQAGVLQAVAIREGLRASEQSESGSETKNEQGETDSRPWFRRIPRIVWVPGTAAAVLAGILLFSPERVPPRLSALGEVEQAPIYLGIPVRQEVVVADSMFDRAMLAYLANEFQAAVTGLEEAVAAGFDPLPAQFFLGSSLLMLDRPSEAAEAFGVVIASGDSPYLPEAYFYRAKALLRLGDIELAQRDLRAAAGASAEISDHAQALADSVEAPVGG